MMKALVNAIKVALIAAVSVSCAAMDGQTEQDVVDQPVAYTASVTEREKPEVIDLDPNLSDQIKQSAYNQLRAKGIEVEIGSMLKVFSVIAYEDIGGREKLIALGSFPAEGELDAFKFFIPPAPGETQEPYAFEQAVVVFTGSPARARSCGPRSGGGTRYCDF